jgi:hypothetical protein
LPEWRQVMELALAAHTAFPEFPSIGWDIAITPSGVVLIEANYNWDVVLAQQPACCGLGATSFLEHYFSWVNWAQQTAASRASH